MLITLPDVVVHTSGENSVPGARGEVGAGYALNVATQVGHGVVLGLLQVPAVINTHHPEGKKQILCLMTQNN